MIQAEKFTPAQIAALVDRLASANLRPTELVPAASAPAKMPPLIAAAGGINAENAGVYAEAAADILVTSSPYLARPRDVQVRIAPTNYTRNA